MSYQPTVVIGTSLILLASALYAFTEAMDRRSVSKEILEKYKSYSSTAETIQARNILSQLQQRESELNSLREICMLDIPEDEKGTRIYQIQYCTDRTIKAMGFDYKLSELQDKAFKSIPSDVLKNTCKVPLPSSVTLFQHAIKKETTLDDGNSHAEKFNQAVSQKETEGS